MDQLKKIQLLPIWIIALPLWVLAGILPKKEDLWIFGAWYGKQYSDNSRALFEKVNEQCPQIQAVWFCHNEVVMKEVQLLGYDAILSYSLKGFWMAIRAHTVIVSSGMVDVNQYAANAPRKVQLWHGIPLKKIGDEARRGGNLIAYKFLRFLFPFIDPAYSLVTSTSKEMLEVMKKSFPRGQRFEITGYPRNDSLIRKASVAKLNNKILYMPTFRNIGNKVIDQMFEGFCPSRIQEMLEKHSAELIIKLHPTQEKPEIDLAGCDRIKIANPKVNSLTNLSEASLLITDYSGTYIDYLLLNRPIIFFPFDEEEYFSTDRGFNFEYKSVTPGPRCHTWSEIEMLISGTILEKCDYSQQRENIKNFFHKYSDEHSTQRLLDILEEQ